MANVVIALSNANFKAGLAGYAKLFPFARHHPKIAASQLVLAAASHALHDFGLACIENQRAGQHHADRFFGAVSQRDVVADAFAVEVHICPRGHADMVDFCCCHGFGEGLAGGNRLTGAPT